jgi:hypothetical protein
MIERPARNADYLDRPEARARLRAHPVPAYLGAKRGAVGYGLLVVVAGAGAVAAWRTVSPWLGLVLALVPAQALVDWAVSWYRVASLAYERAVDERAVDEVHGDPPRTGDGDN